MNVILSVMSPVSLRDVVGHRDGCLPHLKAQGILLFRRQRLDQLVRPASQMPRCLVDFQVFKPKGTDFNGTCPKCNSDLHCCKQCTHFEPSTRFQCLKPVPVRIAVKDKANACTLFAPRVTVAREGTNNGAPAPGPGNGGSNPQGGPPAPRNADDARNAFDRLFKKL